MKSMIQRIQNIAVAALVVFYLTLSVGIDISLHYCLGELKDVSFFSQTIEDCCSDRDCAIERSFDCCDSEFINYQIEEDQLISELSFKYNLNSLNAITAPQSTDGLLDQTNETCNDLMVLDGKSTAPPAYLLNCSLIYYG